jgi:hypothetical protein
MGSRGSITVGGGNVNPITTQNWTLQETEGHDRRQDHEFGSVFNDKDRMVMRFEGNEGSVGVTQEALQVEGGTFTHNHPDNYFGGTFSDADLRVFAKSKWKELRASAGTGNGEYNYIIRARDNMTAKDRKNLAGFIKGHSNVVNKNYVNSYKAANKRFTNQLMKRYDAQIKNGTVKRSDILAQARGQARQYAIGTITRYYKKHLAKFNVDYITRQRAYDYNRPVRG